jgi:hypothetical protein
MNKQTTYINNKKSLLTSNNKKLPLLTEPIIVITCKMDGWKLGV